MGDAGDAGGVCGLRMCLPADVKPFVDAGCVQSVCVGALGCRACRSVSPGLE
jgi:hypothetical protein